MEPLKGTKALVLSSGGLDSTTLLAAACRNYGAENVCSLSISYGQTHGKELASARKVASYFGVSHEELDLLPMFEGSSCSLLQASGTPIPHGSYDDQLDRAENGLVSTYVPFRNGLFLSAAIARALVEDCDIVLYGAHADDAAGDAYPDCSPAFVAAMAQAAYAGTGGNVTIQAPFASMTKADVVKLGLELEVPFELTWSCYEGGEKACGQCGTCIDRLDAFAANGVSDPIEYEEGVYAR